MIVGYIFIGWLACTSPTHSGCSYLNGEWVHMVWTKDMTLAACQVLKAESELEAPKLGGACVAETH